MSIAVTSLADMPLVEREHLLAEITAILRKGLRSGCVQEEDLIAQVSGATGRYEDDVIVGLSRLDVAQDANGCLRLLRA